MIAVETRGAAAATTEADLTAELSETQTGGGILLLTAIADQTPAPALDTNLACPSGTDPISCGQLHQRQTSQAESIVDKLATAPRPAHVDLYALFSQISGYLNEHPAGRHQKINVFINTIGDADTPQNLTVANLASPAQVTAMGNQAVAEGAFPGPGGCRDWQVHMVIPATTDPAHDSGVRDLFGHLISQCGGSLSSWTSRWIAPANRMLVLPSIPGIQSPEPKQTQPTYRIPDTLFDVGSSTVTPEGQGALTQVAAAILARYTGQAFGCVGSADGTGGSSPAVLATDQAISKSRAAAVCDYLVRQGLRGDLAHSEGLGQTTASPDPTQRAVSIIIGTASKG